jgi:RNA polymerase sigma-70 factor (ECF subfamily)
MTSKDSEESLRAAREAEARWSRGMRAAQQGEAEAYQELLQELLVVVRRMVRARLSDSDAAEDVVQIVLLSIHRARHTYQPSRPFGPWMRSIVRNAVTDAHRARGRRAGREVGVEAIDSLPDPNASAVPADAPLSPELGAALAGLSEKQREAVELIHLQGLSVAEAALRAGVSPGALKVRAHRGYRALREKLQGVEIT